MIVILSFGTVLLISLGLYRLAEALFSLPSGETRNALRNLHGKRTLTQKLEKILLHPIAQIIAKFVPLSEYKQKRMAADFDRLGRKETPEHFYNIALSGSLLLVMAGCLLIPIGFPFLTMLTIIAAVLSYFRSTQDIRKKVEKLNHEIEAELPRMVETLNYSLQDNRDLVVFFEKYRKVSGAALGRELDRVTFEMKTGNHSVALRNFDARLQIPQLSALVSILCGVHQGVDQRTSLLILEQDIRTQQRERLRREAEKRPGRIKAASFILTILMIVMFMVPLILLILTNLKSVGF